MQELDTAFEGIPVHYWEGGRGLPLLLIHGSGPGASTHGNWRLIMEPLAERYHVIATDLIGFGLSGRKAEPPYFDMDLWFRQAQAMLDLFGENEVAILGHSISASIALRLAAADKRVKKVMTTGAMGTGFKPNEHTVRTWTFPETLEDLRQAGESLVYDKSVITDEYLEGRMKILHSGSGDYAAYFRSMFAGDKQRYIDAAVLKDEEINAISCDVLMVHGRDDLPYPFEQATLAMSRRIPQADVVALAHCGHSPGIEHPDKVLKLAEMFFG